MIHGKYLDVYRKLRKQLCVLGILSVVEDGGQPILAFGKYRLPSVVFSVDPSGI